MTFKKYKVAISDADIIIDLAAADKLDLLDLVFEEILIPEFVFGEIKKKAKDKMSIIQKYIDSPKGICRVFNRESDVVINRAAKSVIEEAQGIAGPGEIECTGYASALNIHIIISDNYTEFKWFPGYIWLTYYNILVLCIHHKLLNYEAAEEIFNNINNKKSRPLKITFGKVVQITYRKLSEEGWDEYLGVDGTAKTEAALGKIE